MRETRERHAHLQVLLEKQREEYNDLGRKSDHDQIIIQGLREALERTENRLSQAKARQIPTALVGLLGVIRREAAAAEKMIL